MVVIDNTTDNNTIICGILSMVSKHILNDELMKFENKKAEKHKPVVRAIKVIKKTSGIIRFKQLNSLKTWI